jgi:phosphoglycolate phosphatase-like HAD superfamily hydrolase
LNGCPLILDADGVFLSERPYWNAALGAAFSAGGLVERARGRWDALADLAFGPFGLQRITKSAGCNSNWDLAAVLVRALSDDDWRDVLDEMLAAGREHEAIQALQIAARAQRVVERLSDGADPLTQFAIARDSDFYRGVVDRFQQVLYGKAGIGWSFERSRLKEPLETTARALANLQSSSTALRVCTGRHRAEIEPVIRELGLAAFFTPEEITSADEVDRAEALSGIGSLGKPCWFAPACATVGFDRALAALNGKAPLGEGHAIYVGDAAADFLAVEACRERGLRMLYVHVRSGVTTREQEREIAGRNGTLGVVTSLAEIAPLLTAAAS